MRKFNQVVFDEVIYARNPTGHGSCTGTFYTSDTFNYLLGECDQIALQAVTDDVKGTLTSVQLNVAIETSCDAQHWVQKTMGPGEISAPLLLTDTTRLPWGKDDGQRPSYAFVRLRIDMLCTPSQGSVHLVIHVTGRDAGGVTVRAAKASMYQGIPPRKRTKEELAKENAKAWYKNCIKHTNPTDCGALADKYGLDLE
jgi:hypothetical protein